MFGPSLLHDLDVLKKFLSSKKDCRGESWEWQLVLLGIFHVDPWAAWHLHHSL